MSARAWIRAAAAAALSLTLVLPGCVDEAPPDDLGVVEAAMVPAGAGCKGLLNAWENVCPGPSCAVIERELLKHGCMLEPPSGCPCDVEGLDTAWWYNFDTVGLYCWGGEAYSRLSICDTGGQAICVSDLGGADPVVHDMSVCDPCRAFPITASPIGQWPEPTLTMYDCSPPGSVGD